MSIFRIAVENHLKKQRLTLRELLEAAYFRRYGRPIPQGTLDETVLNWDKGVHNVPYLYDMMLGVQCAQ